MDMGQQIIDVAIIGAGPAGMTAGLYAARAGYRVVVFETLSPGGQMGNTDRVDNYPGFPEGVNGFELGWAMKQQAERFGVQIVVAQVVSLDIAGPVKTLDTASESYQAHTVIVATGTRARKLGVPGEEELLGRGVSYCATCDGGFFRGKQVAIVGGANTAVEDALYLSRICEKVTIVYRKGRVRATALYADAAEAADNIEFRYFSVVERIEGHDGTVAAVVVRDVKTGKLERLEVSAVFVAIGALPNSELFAGMLDIDQHGYIVADESCTTNVAGVFVAGDVRTKALRQVVTAVSDGAIAADAAAAYIQTLG